ncbi:MAG: HAD hydrolase-like protein [Kiritimatiellae bacterium]|nr:HAD hydrolase-like protein [Kiritimatiellia bacterium]
MNAAFFDLDGTLFDTRRDLAATVNHTRRDLGLAEIPVETAIGYVGQGAKLLLERSIPEFAPGAPGVPGRDAVPYERLREMFLSHYAEHCCETLEPYPGVIETLRALKERGWLLGLNTNKPNFAVRAILEKFGVSGLFGGAVVAGGDCAELKPSALPLRECAAKMRHELSPEDWMVGDSWTDMECASNAGVKGAFCRFGFGRLRDSRFDASVGSFFELLDHLKSHA